MEQSIVDSESNLSISSHSISSEIFSESFPERSSDSSNDSGNVDDFQEVTEQRSNDETSDPLSILAKVSADLLENVIPSGLDFGDELSDRESPAQVKCFFTRDPARHRVLEKERRGRLRKVMDNLLAKLPEYLWKNRCPNKTRPSQNDVLDAAINYIDKLENIAYRSDVSLQRSENENMKYWISHGYQQCINDLQLLAKREQIQCTDARRLMEHVQSKRIYIPNTDSHSCSRDHISSPQQSYSEQHGYSLISKNKTMKRQFEGDYSTDSLNLSVFKRVKENPTLRLMDDRKYLKRNSSIIPRTVRFENSALLNRIDEQSLLAPTALSNANLSGKHETLSDCSSPPSSSSSICAFVSS